MKCIFCNCNKRHSVLYFVSIIRIQFFAACPPERCRQKSYPEDSNKEFEIEK